LVVGSDTEIITAFFQNINRTRGNIGNNVTVGGRAWITAGATVGLEEEFHREKYSRERKINNSVRPVIVAAARIPKEGINIKLRKKLRSIASR
jgi:hypothetical protein